MKSIIAALSEYISAASEAEVRRSEYKLLVKSVIPGLLFMILFNIVILTVYKVDFKMIATFTVGYLIVIGILVIIDRTAINDTIKSILLNIALSLLLIFIVVSFYPILGTVVWVTSITFIIMAMIRYDKQLIVVLTIVLIGLGFYVWLRYPAVRSNTLVFVSLNIAFTFIFIAAAAVQKIGVDRYKRIQNYLNEAQIIAQVSADIINVNSDNIEDKIMRVSEICSVSFNVERVNIFHLDPDGLNLLHRYEWCHSTAELIKEKIPRISKNEIPNLINHLTSRSVLEISDTDQLDETAKRFIMRDCGIKSMLSLPLFHKNEVMGCVIFQSLSKKIVWHDDQKRMFMVLTNILSDAFSKIEANKEIETMAHYDALTGLPNRFLLNQTISEAVFSAKLHQTILAIMFIDVDSFKSVNDTIGHQGGDALLRQVAASIRLQLRREDVVARFGGDEFVIILKQFDDTDDLIAQSERIMSAFKSPILINNQEFFVTASAGIAVYPDDGSDGDTLLMNADLAMYSSKENGKNKVTLCSRDMKDDVEQKVKMTNLLYKAQQNDEFVLYYQPQINISTRKIIGLEALIRWNNPELGMISPGVFIPLAEQTGLINPIGRWVLETACHQCREWQDKGLPSIRMAVNLSVEQFNNPNLVQMIQDVLQNTMLEPQYLELEITESVAIKETSTISQILYDLKALGVTISIDDFGTDYSSLARIKQLPIDRIKMAMEFVHGITVSEKDEAIAKIIIHLASNLGLKVIAEGVETEPQLEFLEKRVCDEVQGFFFYKPMPAEEVENVLKDELLISDPTKMPV